MHSVCTSAASVADKYCCPDLLHGDDGRSGGDGGCQSQTPMIREAAPHVQDMTYRRTRLRMMSMKQPNERTGPSRGCEPR